MTNKAIFILGMHRSGTSALTRVVNLLGAELGTQLMQAAQDNAKGFFEHEVAVQIHEKLMTALGIGWQDGTPLPEGWQEGDAAQQASKEIAALVDSEFANTPLWAMKDPRQSRLMPLWLPILQERGIEPYFIIAYRHPLEVAASLSKRDQLPEATSLLCWLAYTLESLQVAQGFAHSIMAYDTLIADWQTQMRRIGEELKLEWPVAPATAAEEVDQFLSPDLRHHQQDVAMPETSLVARCMALLEGRADESLEGLIDQWQASCAAIAPLLQQARIESASRLQRWREAQQQAAAAQDALADQQAQFQQLEQKHREVWKKVNELEPEVEEGKRAQIRAQALGDELERVYASASWRMTQPLRDAKNHLARKKVVSSTQND